MDASVVDSHDNPVRGVVFSEFAHVISRALRNEIAKWDPSLALKTEEVLSRIVEAAILGFAPHTSILKTEVALVLSRGEDREALLLQYGIARRLCDARREFAEANGISLEIIPDRAAVEGYGRVMRGLYPRAMMDELLADLSREEAAEVLGCV